MIDQWAGLRAMVSPRRRSTESLAFFLHYRATCLLLLSACLLVGSAAFSDRRIACASLPHPDVSDATMEGYCWAAATYSVRPAYARQVGKEVPHPGIGASEDTSEYTYRNFYQYIHIVLFIQAWLFYIPHFLWKHIDAQQMRTLNCFVAGCSPEGKRESLKAAATYIRQKWGTHRTFALLYLLCEAMASVNILVQAALLNRYFTGEFLGLGLLYGKYYTTEHTEQPVNLFPLVTSCHFKRYGASGHMDVVDALCVLPYNAINVKIYLFLWQWFVVLLVLSSVSQLDFLLKMTIPTYRFVFQRLLNRLIAAPHYETFARLVEAGNFGDWFVLSAVKCSMEELTFYNLMEHLEAKMSLLKEEKKS